MPGFWEGITKEETAALVKYYRMVNETPGRVPARRVRHSFRVFGEKVRACNAGCVASFRADRQHGAIYPAIRDAESREYFSREAASVRYGFCVYCGKVLP